MYRDLRAIFDAALRAVDPTALVHAHLRGADAARAGTVGILGAGKAAARMAAGAEAALGSERVRGRVIVPHGTAASLAAVQVSYGSHPIPDAASLAASAALCATLDAFPPSQPILCLISGGASSLLVQPRPPVTLADKMATNALLLACGAAIDEVNAVRKHLSTVKGGGLARRAGARPVHTLALSDVIGDDPSVIGSGPAVADPSTFADALVVLDRYGLRSQAPQAVRDLLERGARGAVPETLKPGDAGAERLRDTVVGSNRLALTAAADAAARLGYHPVVASAPLTGDSRLAAARWADALGALPPGGRWCAIAGGETTVVVRGRGRGGRNQEFALALVASLAGRPVAALSAGTDGIDGPTDAAGAFVDGLSAARGAALGLDAQARLADNDSYGYFAALGDLLHTGPTGTNVMDIKIALPVGSSG